MVAFSRYSLQLAGQRARLLGRLCTPNMAVLRYRQRDRGRPLSQQRRRIGGIVGGEEPPKNILKDGNYKYDISQGAKQMFAAYNVKSGRVFVLANFLDGTNNINLYRPDGAVVGREGSDTYMQAIKDVCSTYDNFVEVTKEVNHDILLPDFENYVEL